MTITLNPLDTFFFRDGKPFTMGAETWADGVFPPAPSVLYGALRSLWLSQQKDGFSEVNIKASENLRIKKIGLQVGELAIPAPRDLVKEKYYAAYHLTKPIESNFLIKKQGLKAVLPPTEDFVEELSGSNFLNKDSFQAYLNDDLSNLTFHSDIILNESKIGIGRDFETRTTEEGKLYRVDFKRFIAEDTRFVIEFEGLSFNHMDFLRFGGEGKAVHIELLDKKPSIQPPKFEGDEKSFRLVLATPSVFDNGWLPDWINESSFEGEYEGIKLKLVSASLGRPLSIGGFGYNLKNKRFEPKTMFRAIPVGSVYWFDILEGSINDVVTKFHEQSILNSSPKFSQKAKEGFGICYVGR
ncbi:MAG: type III-B CRISPR module-associated protein Cmr3 [Saprospiraceae bacterium]|nr:type III-B CRISPR module-associated protein Cmr3 [Saprospiraceae bacterium]